jgi:hypothetical protein
MTPDLAPQPTLDGIPPPPSPPLRPPLKQLLDEGEPLKCCFMGRTAEPARLIPHPENAERVGVQVLLHQRVAWHTHAVPLLATWWYPAHTGPERAHAGAAALAAGLPEGTDTTVLGIGLETAHHHGAPVLRPLHVLGIKPTAALEKAMSSNQDLFAPQPAAPAAHQPEIRS